MEKCFSFASGAECGTVSRDLSIYCIMESHSLDSSRGHQPACRHSRKIYQDVQSEYHLLNVASGLIDAASF